MESYSGSCSRCQGLCARRRNHRLPSASSARRLGARKLSGSCRSPPTRREYWRLTPGESLPSLSGLASSNAHACTSNRRCQPLVRQARLRRVVVGLLSQTLDEWLKATYAALLNQPTQIQPAVGHLHPPIRRLRQNFTSERLQTLTHHHHHQRINTHHPIHQPPPQQPPCLPKSRSTEVKRFVAQPRNLPRLNKALRRDALGDHFGPTRHSTPARTACGLATPLEGLWAT